MALRTIKCWARILPRHNTHPKRPTRIVGPLYRTKRDALEYKRPDELLVNLKGFYWDLSSASTSPKE